MDRVAKPKPIANWSPARQRIIDIINDGRRALGKKRIIVLPKGWLDSDKGSCLSHALGIPVGTAEDGITCAYPKRRGDAKRLKKAWNTHAHEGFQCWLVNLPEELSTFAFRFDLGDYPDLIEADAEPPYWWQHYRKGGNTIGEYMHAAGFKWDGEELCD